MKNETKHSAVPWRTHIAGSEGVYIFPDSPDLRERTKFIAIVNGRDLLTDKDNAEFIVRACNAHEELLAACKAALISLRAWNVISLPPGPQRGQMAELYEKSPEIKALVESIAKAEGDDNGNKS